MIDQNTLNDVKEYYGKTLSTNADLKTSACCVAGSFSSRIKKLISNIHPEVIEKFYGCGSPIPDELEGLRILDLGSGSGRDCYILSQLVGQNGFVIGVDMTDQQVEVAQKHVDYHMEKFGFSSPNVEFKQGYIEDLKSLDIADNSVDLVISNCVLNLSAHKDKVFSEIFRVLKPGGELYFSDVFSDRRIPKPLFDDPVLKGECLSGAMYLEDFRRLLNQLGCSDYRIVERSPLSLEDSEVHHKIGMINFESITIRAFKLPLEDQCEDYGQVAYYLGSLPGHNHEYILDDHHVFETGKPVLVCSNTAAMISETRLKKHFKITGDTSTHFGLFDCSGDIQKGASSESTSTSCC